MFAGASAQRTSVCTRTSQALAQRWRRRLVHLRPPCRHDALQQRTLATSHLKDESTRASLNVAVLGGGITGLASAYYLAQQLPKAHITLYEGTSRLGGWLHSKQIDVGTGKIVFEQGPRTLRPSRPNGWVTLDLVSKNGFGAASLLKVLLRYVTSP